MASNTGKPERAEWFKAALILLLVEKFLDAFVGEAAAAFWQLVVALAQSVFG